MSSSFNYHAVAPFVSHALSVVVFLFLIVKNPRSKLHLTLGLFCLSASVWQFATGMMFIARTDESALFWDRVVYVAVNLQWVLHFHFTILLLKAKDQKAWLACAYVLAALFAVFVPTDYLVHDLYRYAWGCHSIAGPLHHAFVLVSTGFYIKCLYLIWRRYQQTDSAREREQYKYYMAGFTIFVSASFAYLPAYKISIYPFSYWFESVYCLILVYIIGRHRLLDIETVFHKTLLWLATSAIVFVPIGVAGYLAQRYMVERGAFVSLLTTTGLVGASLALYSVAQPRIDHLFQRKKYDYREVADRFMESVITLNERERLARVTIDVLGGALYAERVRCFWVEQGKMIESAASSSVRTQIPLADEAARYLVSQHVALSREALPLEASDEGVKRELGAVFDATGSQLLLPIVHEQVLRGVVTLHRKKTLKPYTRLDERFLQDIARGMSVAIINTLMFETQRELLCKEKEAREAQEELLRMTDDVNRELEQKVLVRTEELSSTLEQLNAANAALTVTKDALWGEMQLAQKIQTLLLPREPRVRGYEALAYMSPAAEVGGDYYDVINTSARDWVIIGDVSGHGVSAGLVMMMVQAAIHTALAHDPELRPSQLLSVVNEVVTRNVRQMGERKHVTITALACQGDGRFVFSGLHQDIVVYRAESRSVELVETEGVWLGLVSSVAELLHEQTLQLNVGDIMMLFTDGITEAVRKDGAGSARARVREMFGQGRLVKILAEAGSIQSVRSRIIAALEDYVCDDDVTFVLLERTGAVA